MPFDEEDRDFHGECSAEIRRLRGALEAIEGGSFPGASTFAVAGDWKGMYDALQKLARDTLNAHPVIQT